MDEFNIEDYRNYKKVTIAKYHEAKDKIGRLFEDSIKQLKFKDASKYAIIYIELDKLLMQRIAYGDMHGYEGKGRK